jgi:hypothetical protein
MQENEHTPQINPGGSHICTVKHKRVVEVSHKPATIMNNCYQDSGNSHGITDCNPIEIDGKFHSALRKIDKRICSMVLMVTLTLFKLHKGL